MYDYLIIGAGSAGIRFSKLMKKGKILLVEKDRLGGTCVNKGCIPKKLFYYAAQFKNYISIAPSYGWSYEASFSWSELVNNKDKEILRLNKIYGTVLNDNVEIVYGEAKFVNYNTIEVNGKKYQGKKNILSCGNISVKANFLGAKHVLYSDDIFSLKFLPKQILILGGGYIAIEFACILNNLGVKIDLVIRSKLLKEFDCQVVGKLEEVCIEKGISIHKPCILNKIVIKANNQKLCYLNNGEEILVDEVLCALGRKPAIENLNLQDLSLDSKGFVNVDEHFQTNLPNIYALGDIISHSSQLTPIALKHGDYLYNFFISDNSFKFTKPKFIPTSIFAELTLSCVGLTEEQACSLYLGKVKVFESLFTPMFYSMSELISKAFIKLLVYADTDEVLGIHLLCTGSEEIIQILAVLMGKGLTKKDFDDTIAVHPSLAEEFVSMRNFRLV